MTRYDSHTLTPDGRDRVLRIKLMAEQLAREFEEVPGRPASVALTHLQTAVMFGVRAVSETHHEDEAPE